MKKNSKRLLVFLAALLMMIVSTGTGNATSSTGNDMSEWASAGFKLSH